MRTTRMQLLIVGVAMLLAASQAANASVVLEYVEGDWMNPVGGVLSSVNYIYDVDVSNGYGSGWQQQVRWGNPSTIRGQSGLGFIGVAPPTKQVDIGVPFDLFQLTHFNNSLELGTAVNAVDLDVVLGFENASPCELELYFTFQVDETNNNPGPPDNYDIITFPDSYSEQAVVINGENYTLQLLGFGEESYYPQFDFVTPEGHTNSTLLWATLIPEPATVLLLGIGALALLRAKR